MMDQEKVTRVDIALNAVRNTCISDRDTVHITENLNWKEKNNEGQDEFVWLVAHVYAVNNLLVCSTIFFFKSTW